MAESDCEITKAIGGYFELADYENGLFPHPDGVLLNTGRNALEYILRSIGKVKCVYLPYYTCEVVLEPLKKLHIPWMYYHINARFEIADEIHLKEGEYIIVNNYYGIKDAYILTLADQFGDHLIVDCAQAFFARPIRGVKAFYSPRKYVGVADGGIAYLGEAADNCTSILETECTEEHDSHLFKRKLFGAEAGFADFQKNERKLENQPIRWMSNTTRRILDHIDYEKVISIRRRNFEFLQNALEDKNSLRLPDASSFVCPMVYPFISRISRNLREELIDKKVFVAKYWPNIHPLPSFEIEFDLTARCIPIPCDHRYGKDEMIQIVKIVDL